MNVVELTCDQCGRAFTRPRSRYNDTVRRGAKGMFCSHECSHLHARGRTREKRKPPSIPWLKPRDWKEQALGEMIAGAAIEYQHCVEDPYGRPPLHAGEDYWSGYWAALIDYGRRVFDVRAYTGPGGERDNKESKATAGAGASSLPEETLHDL